MLTDLFSFETDGQSFRATERTILLDKACSFYQEALAIYEAGSGADSESAIAVRLVLEDCEN